MLLTALLAKLFLLAGAHGQLLCDCFQSCTTGSGPATSNQNPNINFVTADYFSPTVTVLTDSNGTFSPNGPLQVYSISVEGFVWYECVWSIQAPSGTSIRATVTRTTAETDIGFTMVFIEGQGIFGGTYEEEYDFSQDSFTHTSSSNFLTVLALGIPPFDTFFATMDVFSDLEFSVTYEFV